MKHLEGIEREIVSTLVDDALQAGLLVSVFDGEEYSVKRSADRAAISEGIGATDETTLLFRDPAIKAEGSNRPEAVGSVFLVHGNGSDVLANWTDNDRTNGLLKRALSIVARAI